MTPTESVLQFQDFQAFSPDVEVQTPHPGPAVLFLSESFEKVSLNWSWIDCESFGFLPRKCITQSEENFFLMAIYLYVRVRIFPVG